MNKPLLDSLDKAKQGKGRFVNVFKRPKFREINIKFDTTKNLYWVQWKEGSGEIRFAGDYNSILALLTPLWRRRTKSGNVFEVDISVSRPKSAEIEEDIKADVTSRSKAAKPKPEPPEDKYSKFKEIPKPLADQIQETLMRERKPPCPTCKQTQVKSRGLAESPEGYVFRKFRCFPCQRFFYKPTQHRSEQSKRKLERNKAKAAATTPAAPSDKATGKAPATAAK